MTLRGNESTIGGKVSIFTTLLGVGILFFGVLGELPHGHVARANTATTSVTVLNTPPQWDSSVYVQETTPSASSTPTNAGYTISWYASSSDSSNDNYYLLICRNYASPTPNSGAAPTCSGGSGNQVAVSAATVSGIAATAATTTYNTDVTEIFYYHGYVCDGNATGPACNTLAWSGTNSPSQSPFLVNHRPTFTAFMNTSPANPGDSVSWYATATDQDTYGGTDQDTIKLFVCKAQDFSTSTAGGTCGGGGTWATSTYVVSYATATVSLTIPYTKGSFGAYGYVADSHGGYAASGGSQAANSSLVVNNIAPSISSSTVSLFSATGTTPLVLTNLATQTPNFTVQYTVSDNNSCRTASSTDEINFGLTNVFRSSVGSSSCVTTGNYNANNCYPGTLSSAAWNVTCTASSTSCLGTSDIDVIWTCSFPLWYLADATDVGSQFPSDDWLASVQAADTSYSTTSIIQAQTGTELLQFLGYGVSTTTIAYGGLQPGQDTGTVGGTALDRTDLLAQGNVGLDETLYGDDMCPTYPTCSGNATSTIFVVNQRYASTSVLYSFATSTLSGSPGALFALHVPKTTATATPASRTTYWGIAVPSAITLSGDYIGQNTIIGATSPTSSW